MAALETEEQVGQLERVFVAVCRLWAVMSLVHRQAFVMEVVQVEDLVYSKQWPLYYRD